jgi:hypothetical protein
MSKTLYVRYRNAGFWAYDVAVGILLKHMIDCASAYSGRDDSGWLSECIARWRVNAVMSEYGLHLDEAWTQEQVQVILHLLDEACRSLETLEAISADEMEAWDILNGGGVYARGAVAFPTAPVVELACAIEALLAGTLPNAPEGTWWFYGVESGRTTIARRS